MTNLVRDSGNTRIKGGNYMRNIKGTSLMDFPTYELQGQERANFMDEMKGKTMANGIVAFLKEFPGFCDWWFTTLNEDRRSNIFTGIQIVILNAMNRVSGLPSQKVPAIRNEILSFFDQLPAFSQWHQVVLGSTLRGRVKHQLDDYILGELKRS